MILINIVKHEINKSVAVAGRAGAGAGETAAVSKLSSLWNMDITAQIGCDVSCPGQNVPTPCTGCDTDTYTQQQRRHSELIKNFLGIKV